MATGAFLTLGATAFNVAGAYKSAEGRKMSYRAGAEADRQSAVYAKWQATHEILAGQAQEQQVYMAAAQTKGAQLAALGASGIEMSSGTALTQLTTTDVMSTLDRFTIRDTAAKAAWAKRVQAQQLEYEAATKDWAASNIDPMMEAFTAGLGTVAGGYKNLSDAYAAIPSNASPKT